jgi:hypothetical protein
MKENQVWHCAVKNTTTTKDHWEYHLFYDFDDIKLSEIDVKYLVDFMNQHKQSFILRRTTHGYHLIGLTGNRSLGFTGVMFDNLQRTYPTYHDGQAIRITQKEVGEFIIVAENYDYPFVLNLVKLFRNKGQETNRVEAIRNQWYVLLYYTTNKKNIKNKEVIARHDKKERD